MDTGHQSARQQNPASSVAPRRPGTADAAKAAQIEQQLATIKAHMPMTYADIQRQAREHGNAVFSFVRRGCGGDPGCFYAMEAGHVVGAPFAPPALNAELAALMVQFGVGHLIIWPEPLVHTSAHQPAPDQQEASHGTH